MTATSARVALLVSIVVLAVAVLPHPSVGDVPLNGVIGNPVIPTPMNWTRYWHLVNHYSVWMLEYYDGTAWQLINADLQINRTYLHRDMDNTSQVVPRDEADLCKLTLQFTSSYAAHYRLTLGINHNVKDYTYHAGQPQYVISFQNFSLFFDWSDILTIPNLVVTHGVRDVDGERWFWFRIRRDNVPANVAVVLDPIIGYDQTSLNWGGIGDTQRGMSRQVGAETINVENMTAYIRTTVVANVTGAIYDGDETDPGNLIAQTEERELPDLDGSAWYTFEFPSTVTLTANVWYHFVVWADSFVDEVSIHYDTLIGYKNWKNTGADYSATTPPGNYSDGYDPFPEPSNKYTDYTYAIFCNYTISEGGQDLTFTRVGNLLLHGSMARGVATAATLGSVLTLWASGQAGTALGFHPSGVLRLWAASTASIDTLIQDLTFTLYAAVHLAAATAVGKALTFPGAGVLRLWGAASMATEGIAQDLAFIVGATLRLAVAMAATTAEAVLLLDVLGLAAIAFIFAIVALVLVLALSRD